MKRLSYALGAISALALGAFTQLSPTLFNDEFFERVDGVIRIGPIFNTYYAKNYGTCTWDEVSDVGACINAAITAANNSDNVLGKVVIPAGTYGVTTTITQAVRNGVVVEGAGGHGAYGTCNTRLKWIGSAGGALLSYTPSTQNIIGAGLKGVCLDANAIAATGAFLRGMAGGTFRDVAVLGATSVAWDLDANDTANGLFHDVFFIDTYTSVTGAAKGWKIGQSSTLGNDVADSHWIGGLIQYENGTAFECGAADSIEVLGMDIQNVNAGTGKSLHLLGHATVSNLTCRSNRFITTGGFGRDAASRPVADTAVNPSQKNYIYQNGESGAATPQINGIATLTYDTNTGNHFSNASTASQQTGSYKIGGSDTDPLSILYRKRNNNFTGITQSYRADDSANAEQTYATTFGWVWSNTSGAIEGAYSISAAHTNVLTELVRFRGNGGLELGTNAFGKATGANIVLQNNQAYQTLDSGATLRNLLTLTSGNLTQLSGGSAGLALLDNYGASTIGSSDASGNWLFSNFVTIANNKALQWKDSGGTNRNVLQYNSSNVVLFDGGTSGNTFRNGGTGNTWLTVDTGSTKVLAQHGATNGVPIHIGTAQTTAPALTSCGTSPAIVGTDEAGEVTMGTTATGCIITFNQTYVGVPLCTVTWQATPLASQSYTVSATAITLVQTSTSNNKMNYICRARAGG